MYTNEGNQRILIYTLLIALLMHIKKKDGEEEGKIYLYLIVVCWMYAKKKIKGEEKWSINLKSKRLGGACNIQRIKGWQGTLLLLKFFLLFFFVRCCCCCFCRYCCYYSWVTLHQILSYFNSFEFPYFPVTKMLQKKIDEKNSSFTNKKLTYS